VTFLRRRSGPIESNSPHAKSGSGDSEETDRPPPPPSRRLELSGSTGLPLCVWESGTGPDSIVLLHGLGDHARIWDPILPALPAHARVFAVDLRGHGDSAWSPDSDYARARFEADLREVMQQIGGERRVLIGHSLGGSLAIEYAAKQPSGITGLVALDVGPRVEHVAIRRLSQGLRREASRFASPAAYREHLRRRYWLALPDHLEAFARHAVHQATSGDWVPKLDPGTHQILTDRNPGRDMWAELRGIRCPCLVIRAGISAVLRRDIARRMVEEALPNGRLVEVPRAGHALLLDNPQGVGRALRAFLAEILPPPGRATP